MKKIFHLKASDVVISDEHIDHMYGLAKHLLKINKSLYIMSVDLSIDNINKTLLKSESKDIFIKFDNIKNIIEVDIHGELDDDDCNIILYVVQYFGTIDCIHYPNPTIQEVNLFKIIKE